MNDEVISSNVSLKRSVGSIATEKEIGMKTKDQNYSIESKGNNQYYVSVRIKRNGKDYRKRVTVTGQRNAVAKARNLVSVLEAKAGATTTSSFTTFGQCVEYYKENAENWESNASHLKRVNEELGDVLLSDMQVAYNKMVQKLQKTFTVKGDGRLFTNATINRASQRVSAVLNLCKNQEVIPESIKFKAIKLSETARDRCLTTDEEIALVEAIMMYRPYLMPLVRFAIQVPSRKSELLQLKHSDIDVVNKSVRISIGKTKNGKGVTKPIPPNMLEYFSSIPKECDFAFYRKVPVEPYRVRKKMKPEDVTYKYSPLRSMRNAFDFVATKACIDNLRFHDLRHISATRLLHGGLTEREIMQVAGWKTNMLSTYYHKDSDEASKSAFHVLDQLGRKESPEVSPFTGNMQ